LGSELSLLNLYIVSEKGGFNTTNLIANAYLVFPGDLFPKVPEAIPDIQQATRCLAYELPIACGFHLHRANESVLHRYYDAVTGGKSRPTGRNIGDYLQMLRVHGAGEAKIMAALRDLKDLHRNPLIHPEDSLESVEEAISLLGLVRSVMSSMLKEIPFPLPSLAPVVVSPVPLVSVLLPAGPGEPPD
jgi:hypothetical protein